LRRLVLLLLLLPTLGSCTEREQAFWPVGLKRFDGQVDGDGERTGPWRFFYRQGRLRERGSYRDGLPVGSWTRWYTNGQRAETGERTPLPSGQASPRTGAWESWHANGFRAALGSYDEHGLREGEWQFFGPYGARDGAKSGVYRTGTRQE